MKTQLKELLVLHFLNDGIRTTLIVLLPLIAPTLSLSLTQVGFLGSSQGITGAILALPTGFIIGRFGGYKVVLTLLLIYSLGIIGASFAMNAPVLMIMYLLSALGFGMFHPAGFALTAKISAGKNVGRNMGNFTAVGEIGRVAIPPIALFAAAIVGWRLALGVIGFVGFVLFLLSRFYKGPKDLYTLSSEKGRQENHKQFLKHAFSLFKNKQAACVIIAATIDSLASSPIYVYLPFLLVAKGSNSFELSIAMGGFFVGSLAGKSLLGKFADQVGHKNIFIISEIAMAISLLLITFTNAYFLLVLFAALLGIFTKGTSPVVQTLFSRLADNDHYHKVFAISELVIALASVASITALGALADKQGISIVFYAGALLAVVASVPMIILSRIKINR